MSAIKLTSNNFNNEVLLSGTPVLVDFWAEWCGPCRMLSPVVHEIGEERTDFKVGTVNVDEEPELAEKYGISSIPCLIVFNGGKEVKRNVGVIPKDSVINLVTNA